MHLFKRRRFQLTRKPPWVRPVEYMQQLEQQIDRLQHENATLRAQLAAAQQPPAIPPPPWKQSI